LGRNLDESSSPIYGGGSQNPTIYPKCYYFVDKSILISFFVHKQFVERISQFVPHMQGNHSKWRYICRREQKIYGISTFPQALLRLLKNKTYIHAWTIHPFFPNEAPL
jgi:hypothetical protein